MVSREIKKPHKCRALLNFLPLSSDGKILFTEDGVNL